MNTDKTAEWVDATRELPFFGIPVLASDGREVSICFSTIIGWRSRDAPEQPVIAGISHWMPLPTPPGNPPGMQKVSTRILRGPGSVS